MPDRPTKSRATGYMMALSQVGMEMVVPIVVGVLLDRWWGTVPWLMVGGVLLGLFGGLAHLIAILNRMDRSKADQPPKTPS
jgi:F0F1-type ATP synthase assembly protein I